MADAVYKFIEQAGVSSESWEKAVQTLRDLGIAEVEPPDVLVGNGKIVGYRTRIKPSFKVEKVE
jgi:hypothetical protein